MVGSAHIGVLAELFEEVVQQACQPGVPLDKGLPNHAAPAGARCILQGEFECFRHPCPALTDVTLLQSRLSGSPSMHQGACCGF